MADLINIGAAANDGTGDKLRDAFVKVNGFAVKSMADKGTVTDLDSITETGIYAGTDVTNSPVSGQIMVMANKDSAGNFGYFLMGADLAFHTGGKPAGGAIGWNKVTIDAKPEGTIDIKPDNSGGFPTALLDTFTGKATHNLTDGNEHKVQFVLQAGGDWSTATDTRAWYLHVAELGNIDGASGIISLDTLKQWVAGANVVTMKYDATAKRFHVTKVEGASVVPVSLPQAPATDGDYNLNVATGVVTWKAVTTQASPPPPPSILERPTVESPYSNTPTESELMSAIRLLPHFEDTAEFWNADHDFYVKDVPQTKMVLVKYRGDGSGTEALYFFEKLTKAT